MFVLIDFLLLSYFVGMGRWSRISLQMGVLEYHNGFECVGKVTIKLGAPWRFIWTDSQPVKWHMGPVRSIFVILNGFQFILEGPDPSPGPMDLAMGQGHGPGPWRALGTPTTTTTTTTFSGKWYCPGSTCLRKNIPCGVTPHSDENIRKYVPDVFKI